MDIIELSQSRIDAEAKVNEVQVVEFILGEDTSAINLFDVREIVESVRITPLFLMQPRISRGSSG